MYIFTHYWHKWLVDVILYRHEVQICLKLIYLDFIFMLNYGQQITKLCFNSISMDSDYHNEVFMQCLCLWTANNAFIFAVFLLIFVGYHVTFYSVVETATLPQVVFNSLILYYNFSILYVLSGEFQLKFQI